MPLTPTYPARPLDDGTYAIHDLDIFETCTRIDPSTGARDTFDRAWLQAAADRAAQLAEAGYMAPVHLGHHRPTETAADDAPPFAGFLTNLRVDVLDNREHHGDTETDASDGAAPYAVLRATITGIPADVFATIEARRLPYRSVEIHDPATPEICSLALLDTVVPYFKFPITSVVLATADGALDDTPSAVGADSTVDQPLVLASAATFAGDPREPEVLPNRFGMLFAAITPDGPLHAVAPFAAKATPRAVPSERESPARDRDGGSSDTAALADGDADADKAARSYAARLAADGYVFDADAVRAVLATSTSADATDTQLRRLLPRAPIAPFLAPSIVDADDAQRYAAARCPRDTDAALLDSVLAEAGLIGDPDAPSRARLALREYRAFSRRFQAMGVTADARAWLLHKLTPMTTR